MDLLHGFRESCYAMFWSFVVAVVGYHFLQCRMTDLKFLINLLLYGKAYGSRLTAKELECRVEKLRAETMRVVLSVCSHLFALMLILCGLAVQPLTYKVTSGYGIKLGIFLLIGYGISSGVRLGSITVTPRFVDIFQAIFYMCIIVRVALMENDLAYFILSPHRALFRAVVAVMCMDIRSTVVWNMILSLTVCLRCKANVHLLDFSSDMPRQRAIISILGSELIVYIGVILICQCTRMIAQVCLTAQAEAEDAKSAVQRLLSVLCDAVVRVDASGTITQSSPHFRHLIREGVNVNTEGDAFADHLARDSDRSRLENVIGGEMPPTAIHVNMRRSEGPPVNVQLLFAYWPDSQRKPGHLIGIREMAKMFKEVEVDAPTQQPQQGLRYSESAHRVPSKKTISSSSSTSSQRIRSLKILDSIQFDVDIANATYPLHQCTLRFKSPRTSSYNNTWGSMNRWIPDGQMMNMLTKWLQTSLNNCAHDRNADSLGQFGPLVLHLPFLDRESLVAARSTKLVMSSRDEDDNDADVEENPVDLAAEASEPSASGHSRSEQTDEYRVSLKLQDFVQIHCQGQDLTSVLKSLSLPTIEETTSLPTIEN